MSRRGLLLFVAMCVIWGIPYLFIRIAVSEISPVMLVFLRTTLGAAILLPIAIGRGELRAVLARWPFVILFAAVEIGIPWVSLSSAEQQVSSSLTGLLISAVPLAATIISPLIGNRDRMGIVNIVGLLIGLAGVATIAGFNIHASAWFAVVELGVVVIGYALGPAILTRFLSSLPSVGVTATSLAMCAVAYAIPAALQWPRSMPHVEVIASVAVLAVICTAVAFLLFFALIAEVGPVRSTVITYINPAVAAVAGVLVLHESFTVGMAIGFVLVLAGSALATRRGRAAAETPFAGAEP